MSAENKEQNAEASAEAEKIIAEAKEEAKRMIAEAEKQVNAASEEAKRIAEEAKAKAEKKRKEATPPAANDPEEYVEYTAPLTTPDAKPIVVGCNGEIIRIQRGATVRIKRKFLEVLRNAQEQEYAAFVAQRDAQNASRTAMADL